MDSAPKFTVLSLILLGLAFLLVNVCAGENDLGRCERVVKRWTFSSLRRKGNEDKHTLQDLLFFLHVPRTGGRTYFHCFLRKLYPSSQECPRSYDKLRFDPSKTKCRLLVTHDDYSMMYKLPKERTSVVTILRNPVDRVFSTYEFSIEVAARFLMHPNLTSATQMAGLLRNKSKGVSTLDIWPWKYLVPWMREDLFARRDARRLSHLNEVKDNDSYDMDEISMPLHVYINDPIAHEIVHNGATFQVAGLTNNSYLAESHEVRNCVQKYKILGQHVLQVAKKRLDEMLYVGLTEEHRESATLFADVVGAQVISQLREANVSVDSVADNKSDEGSLVSHPDLTNQDDKSNGMLDQNTVSKDVGAKKENMTVKELMKAYEGCISSLRKSQSQRRTASLKRISPANFSKEARLKVSEVVLQQIRSLNYLDLELYEHARAIFAKQHEHARQKLAVKGWWGSFNYSYDIMLWKVFSAVMTVVLLLLLFFICANSQRRTSKVKI